MTCKWRNEVQAERWASYLANMLKNFKNLIVVLLLLSITQFLSLETKNFFLKSSLELVAQNLYCGQLAARTSSWASMSVIPQNLFISPLYGTQILFLVKMFVFYFQLGPLTPFPHFRILLQFGTTSHASSFAKTHQLLLNKSF